jgi:anti-anti-sigma factor
VRIDFFHRTRRGAAKQGATPAADGRATQSYRPDLLTTTLESRGSVGLITVSGEIEERTADLFVERVQEQMRNFPKLVVDLRQVTFLGVAGHHALQRIQMTHYETGAQWVAIPSPAVRRSLQLFSTNEKIPTAETVATALADYTRE